MRLTVLDNHDHAKPDGGGHWVDARSLERDLVRNVDGEVRFSSADRALYATDSSNYRQVPIGVVVPRNTDAVEAAVAACHRHGAPIVSRGGGTSLCGQCCNIAVVIDHSKYLNRVLDIDPQARTARVQPGCVLDTLRHAAIREHQLTFGPDPSTHAWCTLGGMIGNNSCGVHSIMAGRTADCVEELEILTYDGHRMRVGPTPEPALNALAQKPGREGEIYHGLRSIRDRYGALVRERYPKIPRRVSGYNLDELLPENGFNVARALVGTEGTCVTVLEAKLSLIHWPRFRTMAVVGYPTVYDAGDHVPEIMEFGPIGLEGMDEKLIEHMRARGIHTMETHMLPPGKGWLIVEFGGDTQEEAESKAERMSRRIQRHRGVSGVKMFTLPKDEHAIWDIRESGLGATAFVKGQPDAWEGWEDAAVPPDRVGDYLRAFRKLLDKYDYDTVMYGHFGQGCIHCRIDFDLYTAPGIEKYRRFLDEAAELVVAHGGSISGEHGDGQSKAVLLPKMFGEELIGAFREFKRLWDPLGKMNPGKVVDPYPPTSNLRLGAEYEPRHVETYFAYPDDDNSFARAVLRCVGVGKCRRNQHAFMCPTYRATMEEKHATRGRAHLLWEMLNGEELSDVWRDKGVLEALDLCIGCKGCKKDCPVHVDMATYKAEFLAHHFAGRIRPRQHYSMGMIQVWAGLAEIAPGIANFFGSVPPFSSLAKWLAGVAVERTLPRFADETFTSWFKHRPARTPPATAERVLVVPDLFNDVFYPQTLRAGVDALERLGYRVELPRDRLPEPRPTIHYGMLRRAKRQLRRLVDILRPHARAGVPLVGFEPSSLGVLREEIVTLLPHDEDAKRIQKLATLFSEFVRDRGHALPRVGGRAVFHAHCHQKATLNPDAARDLLRSMGIECEEPEPGCCGMAGSFGFEREHYPISMKIFEENLRPAVERARAGTMLVASGFSCRTQIEQATGRLPLHPAEVVNRALTERATPPPTPASSQPAHAGRGA